MCRNWCCGYRRWCTRNDAETSTPPIAEQVALVTGADAGMGKATVAALLEAGYRVAATDLQNTALAQEFGARTGGLSPLPAYAASKGGVSSLTFSFACEYAPYGVTCNAIAPTFVKTQILTEQVSAERQAELRKSIPVGRFCELAEFAHTVLFLAHPKSGFMTGTVLDLNGGLQFG